MIVARAPLRVSFVGGGSDLPPQGPRPDFGEIVDRVNIAQSMRDRGVFGAVVSAAVGLHVWCIAKPRVDGRFIVNWSEKETTSDPSKIRHAIVRECIAELGLSDRGGLEISFVADVPGRGSGLGSSAATCVSCLHALAPLAGFEDDEITPEWLARTACEIQMQRLSLRQGAQDEYASAYGGIHHFEFLDPCYGGGGAGVSSERLEVAPDVWRKLSMNFSLFSPPAGDTGRRSQDVLDSYEISWKWRGEAIDNAECFAGSLLDPGGSWDAAFSCLENAHSQKKELTPKYAPAACDKLDSLGVAWKLCGAGRTGHILVGAEPRKMRWARQEIEKFWGPKLDCNFVQYGSRLVYRE